MGNYATHVSIYLTLIFGYCVAAYTVGKELTKFQVGIVSLMFIVAAEMQAMTMTLWVQSARDVLIELAKINPEVIDGKGDFEVRQILGIALWQAGILCCLAFMWSVRRSGAK